MIHLHRIFEPITAQSEFITCPDGLDPFKETRGLCGVKALSIASFELLEHCENVYNICIGCITIIKLFMNFHMKSPQIVGIRIPAVH
jgi:hypothetical protein